MLNEILTLPMASAFVGGATVGQIITWLIARRKQQKDIMTGRRFPYQAVVMVMVLATLVYIMYSTQQARNCALRLNLSLSTEQSISKTERDALQNLLFAAINPPPDIVDLPQTDPARIAWGQKLGQQYLATVQSAAQKRVDNIKVADDARQACGQ